MGLGVDFYWYGLMNDINTFSYAAKSVTSKINRKKIRTTIILRDDIFDSSEQDSNDNSDGKNRLVTDGLRTSCAINFGNGSPMPNADIRIYGLKQGTMHKLLRVRWEDMKSMQNIVRIEAGEEGGEYISVFEGNITFAYTDMSDAPNASLVISCQSAIFEAQKPTSPLSFKGKKSVVSIIEEICKGMGYIFENNDVPDSIVAEDISLVDTEISKIRTLCDAHDIELYIEQGLISIAPKGDARKLKIPIISPNTGLIGYPMPTIQGVDLKCFYDPMIRFGGIIRIQDSIMETCNGDWRCFGIVIHIESEMPNGNWFMEIKAAHRSSKDAAITK